MTDDVVYFPVTSVSAAKLIRFFESVASSGEDRYFHPHPFNRFTAEQLLRYKGQDIYLVQEVADVLCGYGMLRGWDEGFAVPSLGIIIHPDYRGRKLGTRFMRFLHQQARDKGAQKVMLKVYPENTKAIALYQNMGYLFSGRDGDQLKGYFSLE